MIKSQKGAWGEAVAAGYLIQHGYEVFIGFGNTSCDLVAVRDKRMVRVEVKAATVATRNLHPAVAGVDRTKFDMLLVVMPDGTVLKDPASSQVYGC